VDGDLTVAPGALLDATTPGDPASTPLLPGALAVDGNVNVEAGAVLLLGCSPFIGCTKAATFDTVGGNLNGNQALGILIHSASVAGNISITGGGGGDNCGPPPAPWSSDPMLAQQHLPVYTDLEDVSVGGNLRILGLQSCYLAALRDQVAGSAGFLGDSVADPDGNEIASNLVDGNLTCYGNQPAAQFGDSNGAPTSSEARPTGSAPSARWPRTRLGRGA